MFLGIKQERGPARVQSHHVIKTPRVHTRFRIQTTGLGTQTARRPDENTTSDGTAESEGVHD